MTDELIERSALGRLEYIAEGGQGRIYRCADLRLADAGHQLAYKEFKAGQVTTSGLEAIVGVRARMAASERALLDEHATWPLRLVRDQGRVVGLLMPLIPDGFVQIGRSLTGAAMRKEREIQFLFLSATRAAKLGFPLVNLHQRFALCQELAEVFALLHRNNVVFGDFNAKNALFSVGPGRDQASIMLVDCDAVRVRGTMSAVPQLNTPDWEPPQAERHTLTAQTDVYKFALFVLRCLSPGTNASTARDVRRVNEVLDQQGQYLMAASMSETPAHRPSAQQWADYFAGLRTGRRATAPAAPGPTAPIQNSPAQNSPAQNSPAPAPRPATSSTAEASGGWRRGPEGNWVRG